MKAYGIPSIDYRGSAKLTYANDEHKIEFEGDFEVKQLETGMIAIQYAVSPSTSTFRIPSTLARNFTLSFSGVDCEGWKLTTSERFLSAPLPHMLFVTPTECNLHPLQLGARLQDVPVCKYDQASFLVSTLLWSEHANYEPAPFELEIQGFQVRVEPVDDYMTVAARILNGGGVEPTARVLVRSVDGKVLPLQNYADFMDDMIYVFRLALGAGVEWYYGEAFEPQTQLPTERIHKFAMHGPFSKVCMDLTPKPDFSELARSFFDDSERVLDWDVAKGLINAFVYACDDDLPLEQRGLLGSTLTELLVAQFLKKKEIGDAIPEKEYRESVFPILKSAINEVDLNQEWKQQIINSLQGAYRRSFRQSLKLLVESLNLPLNREDLNRLVNIRNELVHRVSYPSQFEDWSNDYMLMIWMDFISLCRLMGYRSGFPNLPQDWKLEA